MKKLLGLMMMITATPGSAQTPLSILGYQQLEFVGRIERDGNTICEIDATQSHDERYETTGTSCVIDLSDPTPMRLIGTLKGDDTSGSVDRSFALFDIAPWTRMLHDPNIPFGDRVEQHWQSVKDIYGPVPEWEVELYGPDVKKYFLRNNDDANLRGLWDVDLMAFGPLPTDRNQTALDALQIRTLTQYMFDNGWTEGFDIAPPIPQKGSPERVFYDRALVIYESEGDGISLVVWNPDALSGQPAFYFLAADDHFATPMVHFDGTPFDMNDVMRDAFSSWGYGYLKVFIEDDTWIASAAESAGITSEGTDMIVVDSSNPYGMLTLTFTQGRNIPLLRTAVPDISFSGR